MKFSDVTQYTRSAGYMVNVTLDHLVGHYVRYVTEYGLDVNPDFQRGNVWTERQKVRYVEHMLRGGQTGRDIYLNCRDWNRLTETKSCVLVDGKQRLDALLGFLNDEFQVFGSYFSEFGGTPRFTNGMLNWHVNDLATREEELQWYLDLNGGGTVHTDEDLDKVRDLKDRGVPYVQPSEGELADSARLDRRVVRAYLDAEVARKADKAAATEFLRAEYTKTRKVRRYR